MRRTSTVKNHSLNHAEDRIAGTRGATRRDVAHRQGAESTGREPGWMRALGGVEDFLLTAAPSPSLQGIFAPGSRGARAFREHPGGACSGGTDRPSGPAGPACWERIGQERSWCETGLSTISDRELRLALILVPPDPVFIREVHAALFCSCRDRVPSKRSRWPTAGWGGPSAPRAPPRPRRPRP